MTGGGIAVSRVEQLFAKLQTRTARNAAVGRICLATALSRGSKVVKEGHILNSPEENLAELHSLAARFAKERLPMLRVLGIV